MTGRYDDMIFMERPPSRRARMSPVNRAAQFAPFAALNGHEAAIRESGRLTECKRELEENEKERLNRQICLLASRMEEKPEIAVTYFQPDGRKAGGEYYTFRGVLRKIDPYQACLCFTDGTQIGIEEICSIVDTSVVDIL